jgi:hypothetical protein
MEPSTLVLTALLQLNEQLRQDDAFCGYLDDHAGTGRLLAELWDLYYAHMDRPESPEQLVDAWYENEYEGEAA